MGEILLYRVKDRSNVGSIYRLAYQFGITKIWTYQSASPGKTNTLKTERHIPIEKIDCLADLLANTKLFKIALETGGVEMGVNEINSIKKQDFILSVGNESHGFDEEDLRLFDEVYTLKGIQRNSYNVSHALAIALYEIYF